MLKKLWLALLGVFALLILAAGVVVAYLAALITPNLPSLEALTDYQPKIPLRVFTQEGALIGEFGEERRAIVKIDKVPAHMKQAILAAEDERFYQHGGVDYIGVMRAALTNVAHRGASQGASTITMQVARNFYLSREKTYTRKISEALLAMKIEANLTKDQILEIYMNQIYLGQRAYGFASAAQIYFGKHMDKISVAEAAMLAGLPKAPSRFNPVVNPKRAKTRQHYVLGRMKELRFITAEQHEAATKEALQVKRDTQAFEVKADHLAEMVRLMLYEQYKDDIYTKGFRVYTTIRKEDQLAANAALRQGVLDYDKRHGYRGPEAFAELPAKPEELAETLEEALSELDDVNGLEPAVVLEAKGDSVKAYIKSGETVEIKGDGLKLVQKALADKAASKQRIKRGAIIRLNKTGKGWEILQLPQVEASFVSLSPIDGSIKSLAGGFDFARNKFNHVAQAWRQPGSSFKPFIYSAALEKGYTPATIINDAPISISAAETGSQAWEPKNYDGTFDGPIPMRQAIVKSKNLVSVRILQTIGPQYAQDYIKRFGFDAEKHPPYLTMALGAGSVTPLQMATGYSVFANGGYRIQPFYIDRILDNNGKTLAQANPKKAGDEQDRVIDARNAFIMASMLGDVTRFGTAARAASLKRPDIAGKTGTTNDHIDAWFCGFNQSLVGVAWIGFDQPKPMGGQETGGQSALPIWMSYMAKVLPKIPEVMPTPPDGVVNLKVGGRGAAGSGTDYFYKENIPVIEDESAKKPADEVKNQLF